MSDKKFNRPQQPTPPYPYIQEEIAYPNQTDGITISGTLAMPNTVGAFPAVMLVSGMGPNDRNYSMLGHQPFLVLADYLTRHGIAVLRVDKRGVGKSTGAFGPFVTSKDLARDVQSGIDYLTTRKEIDRNAIGLIGHSEGGLIAAMVARQSQSVSFLILMAGAMVTGVEQVLTQVGMQLKADGASKELIDYDAQVREKLLRVVKQESDADTAAAAMRSIMAAYFASLPVTVKAETEKLLFAIKESNAEDMIAFFNSPTYRYWLGHDCVSDLSAVHVPVLAMNGDLDFITVSSIQLPIIKKALDSAGNRDATIVDLPKMNHWFQSCSTGAMSEYGILQETISPIVLGLIADWIRIRFVIKK
ncbi:MAG TPA: alpha/beta fold hydrolase [Candidatus Babeliales bacterium]|nr:alpha/beta fold hydrolase [Candidatus Babeliales bacterium]